MIYILPKPEFEIRKRDRLLAYSAYVSSAKDFSSRIPKAAKRLADTEWLAEHDESDLARLTRARANYALDLLTLSYSAGVEVHSLQKFFPSVVEYFEEYALYTQAFNRTAEGMRELTANIYLQSTEFTVANRSVCFCILLGHTALIPRVMNFIEYNNPVQDGMLERLAAVYMDRPVPLPTECTRHLPYYKTLPIFDAAPSDRPALVREYLQDWYEASRREPYYDAQARGQEFLGYWSWEAAALTAALHVNDTTYRELEFYPGDLLDSAMASLGNTPGAIVSSPKDIRAKAGDMCPITGEWESIGVPAQHARYTAGEVMRDLRSPYGLTVWRLRSAQ